MSEYDIKDIDERLRKLGETLARSEGEAKSNRVWASIFGIVILAWLGITSFIHIPQAVRDGLGTTAEVKEQVDNILEDTQTASAQFAATIESLPFLEVEVMNARHRNLEKGDGYYFNFNKDELLPYVLPEVVDAENPAFATLINLRTGAVGAGQLFRGNGLASDNDADGTAHGRFDPWSVIQETDWKKGDRVLILSSSYLILPEVE